MLAVLNRGVVQPWADWRAGSRRLRYLRWLHEREFDAAERIQARQLAALQEIVRFAWATVPFYRARFRAAGVHPSDLKSLKDLEAFPILTKDDLRAAGVRLRSDVYADADVYAKATSGSTGTPVRVVVDRDAMDWKRAATILHDQWSGWRLGQRVARLWGHGRAERGSWRARLRRRLVERESYLNTLGVDDDALRTFAQALERRPPGLLCGHAHSLYLFALWVKSRRPGTIRPRGIVSTAMPLHDWQRRVIEGALGVPVTNRYGCEEVSLIASECEAHDGLHLHAEGLYCEIQPLQGPGIGGSAGALLITDLRNRAMPLIRYQVGDVAAWASGRCRCGRAGPRLREILGREADFILTPDGRLVSGISLTDHFATEIRGAAQVQLVQEDLRRVRVRVVPGDGFGPESQRQVGGLVREVFGRGMDYELEVLDSIPPEPSGKYRFCISPIAAAYLQALART